MAGSAFLRDKQAEKLLIDLRGMIETARSQVAHIIDSGLVLLYWRIGKRIQHDILAGKRAEYGKRIVDEIGERLYAEYGRGFSRTNLFNMVRFATAYPNEKIVHTLCGQLGWSHFRQIIYLEDPLQRDFYAEMCRTERWNVPTLIRKIQGMLYERTALSKKTSKLVKQELAALRKEDKWSPDLVFRDPYILDFLQLQGAYSEKDLESAILKELEKFLIEIGTDFAFLGRQKRILIGRKDHYLDLLFYHRGLRRMVAIELKLGPFQAEHMGQMELYLRWLERHEVRQGENSPLGLILCTGKDHGEIELLKLDQRGIRVSEYMTQFPSRKVLEKKLEDAARLATQQLLEARKSEK
jgi:predicted nuclease of restriction endonuclease-like (RecB) superfamily